MALQLRNKVLAKRTTKQMTQSELAEKADVTRQTIAAIEKESYVPSALLAFNLASALDTPIDQLFWLEEK